AGSLPIWRRDDGSGPMALRITKRGLEAIGVKDVAVGASTETSVSPAPDRTEVAPLQSRLSPLASGLPLQRRRPFARGIARARRRLKLAPRAKAGQGRNKLACSPCWAGRREQRLRPLCASPVGSSIRFAASSLAWCARSSALNCVRRNPVAVSGSIASSTAAQHGRLPAPRVVAQLERYATRGDWSGGAG